MNLSSQAGKHGFPLRSAYAAAKWGVIGFTKSIAIELGPFGIRVNALLPGFVAGDRIRRVIEAKAQQDGVSFKEKEAELLRSVSLKDYVTPQQLADMVVFTASPRGEDRSRGRRSRCAAIRICWVKHGVRPGGSDTYLPRVALGSRPQSAPKRSSVPSALSAKRQSLPRPGHW